MSHDLRARGIVLWTQPIDTSQSDVLCVGGAYLGQSDADLRARWFAYLLEQQRTMRRRGSYRKCPQWWVSRTRGGSLGEIQVASSAHPDSIPIVTAYIARRNAGLQQFNSFLSRFLAEQGLNCDEDPQKAWSASMLRAARRGFIRRLIGWLFDVSS